MVDSDHLARIAHVLPPAKRRRRLHRYPRFNARWDHAVPVLLRLLVEDLPARHTDDPRPDASLLQELGRLHCNVHFRAGCHENNLRRAAVRLRRDGSLWRMLPELSKTITTRMEVRASAPEAGGRPSQGLLALPHF